MSQIMGLPADDLLKLTVKDMTVWEKGRYAGYKAAIGDMRQYCESLIEVEKKQGTDEMNYGQERVHQTEAILHHLDYMEFGEDKT